MSHQVLALTRHAELLEDPNCGASPELDEKIRLRSPYVAPLNILQVKDGSKGEVGVGGGEGSG